ncbi:hypothetical protein ACS0TY_036084 [Phlomoides rotata]
MTSNAIESFNSLIQESRTLPITHMIDTIRKGISAWFVARRKHSQTWTGALCPTKEETWNLLSDICRSWLVVECTASDFEVSSIPSVTVNLQSKSCSCHQWQVTGFPCAHAVAVIRRHCDSVYSHVSDYFFTTKYRECYMHDIHPISDTELFESIPTLEKPIMPPTLKRTPGHPKRKRVPSYGEFPKKKQRCCSKCGKIANHDSVTCILHQKQTSKTVSSEDNSRENSEKIS